MSPQVGVLIEIDLRVGARRGDVYIDRDALERARRAAQNVTWVPPGGDVELHVDTGFPPPEVLDVILANGSHLRSIRVRHHDPEGADRWVRGLRGEDVYGLTG